MCVGILNLPKMPALAGIDDFEGVSFHTARWNYAYTGGSPTDPNLANLADKVVAVVGTGGSGIQCVPPLGRSSKHIYVFQRTPSAIGWRGNHPTEPDFVEHLSPGWQQERTDNFSAVMIGKPVEVDVVDDAWTEYMAQSGELHARTGDVARKRGARGRGVRLLRDGATPRTRRRDSSTTPPSPRPSSRTTGTCASVLCSTTSTSRHSTSRTSRSSIARPGSSASRHADSSRTARSSKSTASCTPPVSKPK